MLSSVQRRLSRIEDSIPVPPTAERFSARAILHANRTGGSIESALATLAEELHGDELESLSVEFEKVAFRNQPTRGARN